MSPEDMQRFEVDVARFAEGALLSCGRCTWLCDIDTPLPLAELVQRAEEHTEVCR